MNIGFEREFRGHKILGWTSDAQVAWYNKLVKKVNGGVIVEVGVYGGHTLLGISDVCAENNNKLFGIDPWEKLEKPNGQTWDGDRQERLKYFQGVLKDVRENLVKIIEIESLNHIELIHGFSPAEASRFDNESIDLVFIDGSHCYDAVMADLKGWHTKIKPDGKICGDDFVWPEVARAIRDFAKGKGFKVLQGDSIGADPRCWELVKR